MISVLATKTAADIAEAFFELARISIAKLHSQAIQAGGQPKSYCNRVLWHVCA